MRLSDVDGNISAGIDGAPQIHAPAADRDKHLIEMPAIVDLAMHPTKAPGVFASKPGNPAVDRLAADVDSAFCQESVAFT